MGAAAEWSAADEASDDSTTRPIVPCVRLPPPIARPPVGRDRRKRSADATLGSEFQPRVEFDNYKASYLRM